MTEKKETVNIEDLVAKTSERLSDVEGDTEARIVETLLNEQAETPEEIAELEAIPDEEESSNTKMEFVIKDGPMKNLHTKHIQANEKRINN